MCHLDALIVSVFNAISQSARVALEHKTSFKWHGCTAKDTQYGSELSVCILCPKSKRFLVKIIIHEDIYVNVLP